MKRAAALPRVLAAGLLLVSLILAMTASAAEPAPQAPPEHRRGPDQTFLTFPEWYLVHSPAEYAAYLGSGAAPSRFPLFSHIGQFWQGYRAVARESVQYPFNGGYHTMVMVIGTSTTVEYGLKGLYEHTVGRLAEATRRSAGPLPEERFAADYAQAYVDFIRVDPWYKFDFATRLKALWTEVPLGGPDVLRRWERRFALTSELLAKEGYARLIKLGTQSLYDAPKPVTAVVLSAEPAAGRETHPDYMRLASVADANGAVLATIPRYEAFTAYMRWLAAQGIEVSEIAGNRGDIVVSLLVPDGWQSLGGSTRTMFEQPILTQPGRKRVVLALPVAGLSSLMRAENDRVRIEHVYDY
jgi:hypothetical protein